MTSVPQVGLGTWKLEKETAASVIESAIGCGYRLIDCASDYGNEVQVGNGINAAIASKTVRREDLFITTKLWNSFHSKDHVKMACKQSLKDLNLDYIDLYLIHFPIASAYVDFNVRYPPGWSIDGKSMLITPAKVSIYETWTAMEELVTSGHCKHIGVSNFNCVLLRELLSFCKIKPLMNQVELHPYLVQQRLQDFCRDHQILMTAYSSFGDVSYKSLGLGKAEVPALLELELIKKVADAHNKTPAQILLHWASQQGLYIIPKSSNTARLVQNLETNDFQLSKDEMACISGLDRNLRYNNPAEYGNFPIFD